MEIVRLFIAGLLLVCALPAFAGFDEGEAAYQRQDYATALKEWKPLAEQGNVKAQGKIGGMYYIGDGVEQDYVEAMRWYRMAAEQGDAEAQFIVGSMYDNGQGGIKQDSYEALKWLSKAAEQDFGKAMKWSKAAKRGIIDAQYHLGSLNYKNEEYAEAMRWFLKAAKQGDASAQAMIGLMYEYGKSVPKSNMNALKWHKAAAKSGSIHAMERLGKVYENGELGEKRNLKLAQQWYDKAQKVRAAN